MPWFMIILLIVFILVASFAALYHIPRIITKHPFSTRPFLKSRKFQKDFLWGSGEDPYQHEGGNISSDWYEWEKNHPENFADSPDICADFWNKYEQDFDLAAMDHHNAHRIGIEWSRVEPAKGIQNEMAWSRYRAMVD